MDWDPAAMMDGCGHSTEESGRNIVCMKSCLWQNCNQEFTI